MHKLLCLLILTMPAFGQYSQRQAVVFTAQGKPANQATVTVCASTDATCATPITIYSSSIGAAKSNPFSTDSVGNYSFFQQTGYYTVKESYQGSSYTYQILLGDTVHCISPSDFGAKIDGVTNDTAAIQAAHDFVVAHGFTNVCFPAGTYKVTSGLTWSPYVQTMSLGRVILQTALASGNFITISDQYGKPSPDPNSTGLTRSHTFTGDFHLQNTNLSNTATAMFIGGATNANYASQLSIDGLNITGFQGAVFKLGYNSFILDFFNIFAYFNHGAPQLTFAPGVTNSGEKVFFSHSTFSDSTGGAATAYLLSINSGLQIDIHFVGVSADFLKGINDPAQTATLTQAFFTDYHFEWDVAGVPYIDAENGIQIFTTNGKLASPLAVFNAPFVAEVGGTSFLSMQGARYEFGGTVTTAYDLGSSTGTLSLWDPTANTANAITNYYTYNKSGHMIVGGRDIGTDIQVGSDTASTNQVYKKFTTAHAAGNVPSQMNYGIQDGGFSGMLVKNVRDGSFNSQSIEFATQHGGTSTGTRLTLDKDGNAIFVAQIQSSLTTGTAPFSITSTTPVANLATTPTTYSHTGTQQTNVHVVKDACTLGTSCSVTLTGSAAFSSSSSYVCMPIDTTAAAAIKFAPSAGNAFALTGTGTDVLNYVCLGN